MLCTTFFCQLKRTKHINHGINPYTGQAVNRKLILLRFLSVANRQNTSHETAGHTTLLLKKPGLDQNPHEEST
jgi:hypothetical protein